MTEKKETLEYLERVKQLRKDAQAARDKIDRALAELNLIFVQLNEIERALSSGK